LPIDTVNNAKQFIEIIKPQAVFFIKYEFWFNYLIELKKKKIPVYLISVIFRKEQYFFKWYGSWFRKQLNNYTCIFLQDEISQKLLNSISISNCTIAGDTRFDRVAEVATGTKRIEMVELFKGNSKILVAGSTWQEDEKLLFQLIQNSKLKTQNLKFIIVPHEIHEKHIQSIIELFSASKVIRYSQAKEETIAQYEILIVDNIGMLSSLYYYADVAYVGGGFGIGIHKILEAAVFGLPVFFGPHYHKFEEAKELIKRGGAFSVNSHPSFEKLFSQIMQDQNALSQTGSISRQYVAEKVGTTDKILKEIKTI